MMNQTRHKMKTVPRRRRWYERFFPFIARSPEMQFEWLAGVFRKKVLSSQEIRPYIRLMLVDDEDAGIMDELRILFGRADERFIEQLLSAADIYDLPKLLRLIHNLTPDQAVIALRKEPPPYEKSPQPLLDRVFHAINGFSPALLEKAVEIIRAEGNPPGYFEQAYERFQEALRDKSLLSELYPMARGDSWPGANARNRSPGI